MRTARISMISRWNRRGFTTPAFAVALVVVMLMLALICDRLWIEAARVELQTGAETAALAAARSLASDELLKEKPDPSYLETARYQAAHVASLNLVAGEPLELNQGFQGDIRLGELESTGDDAGDFDRPPQADVSSPDDSTQVLSPTELTTSRDNVVFSRNTRFVETDESPTSVVVFGERTRFRQNPVGLFVVGATGLPWGDVSTHAEASLLSPVVGLRPLDGSSTPLLPLAIMRSEGTGSVDQTWQKAITENGGPDEWSFDETTSTISRGADGLPELKLTFGLPTSSSSAVTNAVLLDLGSDFNTDLVASQIVEGVRGENLLNWNGELRLPVEATRKAMLAESKEQQDSDEQDASASSTEARLSMPASLIDLKTAERDALTSLIGQNRIVILFNAGGTSDSKNRKNESESNTTRVKSDLQVAAVSLAVVRILEVIDEKGGRCEVIVQPSVLATRTAIVDVSDPRQQASQPQYLYQLRLTN